MAFGGLGVVGVWEFWARIEFANWDGLLGGEKFQLREFRWFDSLAGFSHPPAIGDGDAGGGGDGMELDEIEMEEAESESSSILSGIISTIFLPRVGKLVKESFDVYDQGENDVLLQVLEEVGYFVERSSERYKVRLYVLPDVWGRLLMRSMAIGIDPVDSLKIQLSDPRDPIPHPPAPSSSDSHRIVFINDKESTPAFSILPTTQPFRILRDEERIHQ